LPQGYAWFIRLSLLILCIVGGWALYVGLTLGRVTLSVLEGKDMLAIIGLSFGIYATIQIILRYVAIPGPQIVTASRQPARLGPAETQTIPANAPDEVRQLIEGNNLRRQFAVHHLNVCNHDVLRFLRPLTQRITAEGCVIRFRYTRLNSNREESAANGEWFFGRWDDNPEPVTRTGFDLGAAVVNRKLAKLFPTEKQGNIDAHPFSVAFAIKKEGEESFSHFNDESYAWGFGWHNPHWQLGIGTYKVEVRLTGYGLLRTTTRKFRLINRGTTFEEWVLEEW